MKDGSKKEFPGERFTDEQIKFFSKKSCSGIGCCDCPFNEVLYCKLSKYRSREKLLIDKIERVYDTAQVATANPTKENELTSDEIQEVMDFATKHGWKKKPKKVKKTFWLVSANYREGVRYTSCLYADRTEVEQRFNDYTPEGKQIHGIEIEVDE